MDEIKVKVHDYGKHRNLVLQWIDPVSEKRESKTAGTRDRKQAERAAAIKEQELRSGKHCAPARMTWAEARERYEDEYLVNLKDSGSSHLKALNSFERAIKPNRLIKLTAPVMSKYQQQELNRVSEMTGRKLSPKTVANYLRHIKAFLNWCVNQGYMDACPKIIMPKKAKGESHAKGRPITLEEHERMLAVTDKLRPDDAEKVKHFMEGLLLSGFRLDEAVRFSWDWEDDFYVDLTGKYPVLVIQNDGQKSGKSEMLPIVPDFADFLLAIPECDRHGKVFKTGLGKARLCHLIAEIGKAAGVVVARQGGKVKYASAHDYRRTFATRMAQKGVSVLQLQKLMRHANIKTTMDYYVGLEAQSMASDLWEKFGNQSKTVDNTLTTKENEKEENAI